MGDLGSIVKAYDIRGVVPDQLDEGVAEAVGAAFARLTGAATILTVHDMRASSAPLAAAFGRGVAGQGANVLAAGLGSTDMLYFGSGSQHPGRDGHGQPQPAPVQRHQTLPRRGPAGQHRDRPEPPRQPVNELPPLVPA